MGEASRPSRGDEQPATPPAPVAQIWAFEDRSWTQTRGGPGRPHLCRWLGRDWGCQSPTSSRPPRRSSTPSGPGA